MEVDEQDFPMTSYSSPSATFVQRNVADSNSPAANAHLDEKDYNNITRTAASMPPSGSQRQPGQHPYRRPHENNPTLANDPRQGQVDPYHYVPPFRYDSGLHPPLSQYPSASSFPSNIYPSYAPDTPIQSDSHRVGDSGDISNATSSSPTVDDSASFMNSLRRYHEEQSRSHAEALQQLTHVHERRNPDLGFAPTEDTTLFSHPFGIAAPSTAAAELAGGPERYQSPVVPSSIPMSNIIQHQEHRHSQDISALAPESQPFQPLGQQQYSYRRDYSQSLRYQQSASLGTMSNDDQSLDLANVRRGDQVQDFDPPPFPAGSAPSPHVPFATVTSGASSASPVPFQSTLDVLRSGARSNANRQNVQQSTTFPTTFRTPSRASVNNEDTAFSRPPSAASSKVSFDLIAHDRKVVEDEPLGTFRKKVSRREGIGDVAEGRSFSANSTNRKCKGSDEKLEEKVVRSSSAISSSRATSGSPVGEETEAAPAAKKRKKSKMHECDICRKKFPRPSGLKTHMNTHNNERPFACGFPGCTRTFGVRSNAKRHLRTHGVIPQQSSGTPPYVVDFSTPVVLQHDAAGVSIEGSAFESGGVTQGSSGSGSSSQVAPGRSGRGRGRQFKLRWMPPSSTTRTSTRGRKGKVREAAHEEIQEESGDDDDDPDAEADIDEEMDQQGDDDDDEEEEDQHVLPEGEIIDRVIITPPSAIGQESMSGPSNRSGSTASARSTFPSSAPPSSASDSPISPSFSSRQGSFPEGLDAVATGRTSSSLYLACITGSTNPAHRQTPQVNHPFAQTPFSNVVSC